MGLWLCWDHNCLVKEGDVLEQYFTSLALAGLEEGASPASFSPLRETVSFQSIPQESGLALRQKHLQLREGTRKAALRQLCRWLRRGAARAI